MNYKMRKATIKDIPFIVETVIEAEKSGTSKLGLATLFHLKEIEIRKYLTSIFSEEINGCEFSLSSFIVIDFEGQSVAAAGGWIEGKNEDGLPSSILKANLLNYYFPKQSLFQMKERIDIISGIQIERECDSYQIEYVYIKPEFRGNGLLKTLIEAHVKQALGCDKMFVQVFDNNKNAIKAYENVGFKVCQSFRSDHVETKNYLPCDTKLLMIKQLKNIEL